MFGSGRAMTALVVAIGLIVGMPAAPAAANRRWSVIAHRGGMGLWPQNSARAFDRAVRAGYPVLETDVGSTRDGVLVLWHEDAVWLSCRGGFSGRRVHELTWRQLSRVRCAGEPILRLDALVKRLTRPDARRAVLFPEPKERGLSGRIRSMTRRLGGRVILQSFDPNDLLPGMPNCLLGGDLATALATPWITCVGAAAWQATPELVAAAHAAGRVVFVYTVDDPGEMAGLICRPDAVDGLITDRPDLASALRC